jgi:hypothetical protein
MALLDRIHENVEAWMFELDRSADMLFQHVSTTYSPQTRILSFTLPQFVATSIFMYYSLLRTINPSTNKYALYTPPRKPAMQKHE